MGVFVSKGNMGHRRVRPERFDWAPVTPGRHRTYGESGLRPASLAASLGRVPGSGRALLLLASAMLLAMTTWFSATAVLPQLRAAWALTMVQASLLTIAVQVGFAVGALVSAFFNLADIVAARTLMLLGALGAAAVNVLLVGMHSAGPAIGLRFLTGAFLAGVYPPGLKAMSTWFRAGRGTALGIMVGALTLGSAVPQFLNGIGGADWHTVIVATSVLTVLGGLTARCLVPDGPFPFPRAIFAPRQTACVMRNRAVRLAVLGYFGHQWELYAMWAWIFAFSRAAFAVNGDANSTRDAAFAAAAIIGSGAVGCWVGGILGDRWGRARLTRLAMTLSGTCCVLIGPVARLGVAPMIALSVFWGFWVVADSAQFSSIVTEASEQRYAGTAVTLQLATGFTLTVVTIWLIPVVQRAVGWTWAFTVLAPGPLLGVVAMTRLLHTPEARVAGGRHLPVKTAR
jgi:MFS family permease